ncbi:MAG: terminase TerL endonuclease subunit [Clostridiaceae bacterium]|nr:terminase TerL endonuclease subunit [Clostridiaceae bacterium]
MSDIKDELIQYANDCISGEIVSCKKLKWACMRFLRDLDRQGTEDFPYIFDSSKAQQFIDWMGLFKHTKGPLAGTYKISHISEKFEFGNIYGWVHKDTSLRRFRTVYIQKARKNAKSQDLAMMALYELSALGESCSEVYVAATKREQTKYVWEEADLIYKRSDFLRDKFVTKYGVIEHPKSGSKFIRLSKDDAKKGSGSNPQCGILDEYHEHETSEYYDLITSGMKTRQQPILVIITTAGVNLNSPCYKEVYTYASKILDSDNPTENDRYFAVIYELDKDENGELIDDINDESCWRKSNPVIYNDPTALENIRAELAVAKDVPEKMLDFLTKTMNVWVNQRAAGYMQMDRWAKCAATKENPMPNVDGLEVVTGLDLSMTTDLTSTSHEIRLPDGKIGVMSHSFMPKETLQKRARQDHTQYPAWVKAGWITATPGAVVDYDYILDYLDKTYELHHWKKGEVCYDRAMATWLAQRLEERGYIPVEVIQGMYTLGNPTKHFRDEVYKGNVIHENNPVLTWAMGNAVTRCDSNENLMLDKVHSTERIDPAAALMDAHVRYILKNPKMTYEKHGLRSLADD